MVEEERGSEGLPGLLLTYNYVDVACRAMCLLHYPL